MGRASSTTVEKRFYRVREICALAGLTKPMVYRALRQGKLRGFKLGKMLLIDARSVDEWFAEAVPWEPRTKTRRR
jgi:excisionase family DNA binding protein